MAIHKRPGSANWYIKFSANGQTIRRSAGTPDREKAVRLEAKLRHEIWSKSELDIKPRRLWVDAVVRWADETQSLKSRHTYLQRLRWLDPHLAGCFLDEITSGRIAEIVGLKAAEGASPATVNRYRAAIRMILNKAHREWEWIDRVPPVRMEREPAGHERWLSPTEADQLIDAAPDWLRGPIEFSLMTGLRQSNVFGLLWDQVDLKRRHAIIAAENSKSGKALGVPLNESAVAVLRRQIGKHQTHVFCGSTGTAITQLGSTRWKKVVEQAGIEYLRWHDLRHTWATWHVQGGTTLHDLYALGGWSSYKMVLRYAHHAPGALASAAESVSLSTQKRTQSENTLNNVVKLSD